MNEESGRPKRVHTSVVMGAHIPMKLHTCRPYGAEFRENCTCVSQIGHSRKETAD